MAGLDPEPETKASDAHSAGLSESIRGSQVAVTPLLVSGGGQPKRPINPSLLEALDSGAAAEVKAGLQPKDTGPAGDRYGRAEGLDLSRVPQVRRHRLDTAPSSLTAEDKPRRRRRSKIAPKSGGSMQSEFSTDMSVDEGSSRRSRRAKAAILKSGGSGGSRMHGQDSLEVRSVTLANGQKASLILEEGKLQRIVAANGQVAELRWNPPSLNRIKGPRPSQLSVKVHPGVTAPRPVESNPAVPATIRRWANSLNSQRLTTGPLSNSRKETLLSAPGGYTSQDGNELMTSRSMDLPREREATPKKKSFVQTLLSLPAVNTDKTSSQGDMPTIMETNREVHKDWNPIHESWLPSTMTVPGTAQHAKTKTAKALEPGTEADSGVSNSSIGRSVSDRHVLTQSLDAGMESGYNNRNQSFQSRGGRRRASISEGAYKDSAIFDSDPGGTAVRRKKRGFWKALRRILHLPLVSKPRTPQSSREADGSKRSSFAKRFSLGGGWRGTSRSVAEGAKHLPNKNDESHRMQSAPVLPEMPAESSESGSSARRLRSRSARGMDRNERNEHARYRVGEVALPATPQQPGDYRRQAEVTPTPSDSGGRRGELTDSPEPVTPDTGRARGTIAGELVTTSELQVALAHRTGLREAQSNGVSEEEKKGSLRSRRRRALDLEKPLSGGKPRTMMGGKWQKNFTEGTSGGKVDDLLQVSSLQRLARERIVEMEIVETEETFEMVWRIPLNGSASKISKTDRYLKNGEVVEAARRDGRPGVLRSQLTFTPEGHVHIRALQGEPFSAVFHDRIKLSTGGRRIKIEQKFQLLQPGILPVKHHSIWNRVE